MHMYVFFLLFALVRVSAKVAQIPPVTGTVRWARGGGKTSPAPRHPRKPAQRVPELEPKIRDSDPWAWRDLRTLR